MHRMHTDIPIALALRRRTRRSQSLCAIVDPNWRKRARARAISARRIKCSIYVCVHMCNFMEHICQPCPVRFCNGIFNSLCENMQTLYTFGGGAWKTRNILKYHCYFLELDEMSVRNRVDGYVIYHILHTYHIRKKKTSRTVLFHPAQNKWVRYWNRMMNNMVLIERLQWRMKCDDRFYYILRFAHAV